jgi:diadenosine tetraphosphatase ApaH/serine/threonine PP2A family protein phosphatase
MRILILSDVHANLTALEAVLADAAGQYDAAWNLGDTVGYGPDPVAVWARLNEVCAVQLGGNHDLAATTGEEIDSFNPFARQAAIWTGEQLTPEIRDDLAHRPGHLILDDAIVIAHGSPRDPFHEYVLDEITATANLLHVAGDLCLVGHSHVAFTATIRPGDKTARLAALEPGASVDLDSGRILANPGSVGQPRDGDPRAAFAILNTETNMFEARRVTYDVAAVQARMRAAGLHERLVTRLAVGR